MVQKKYYYGGVNFWGLLLIALIVLKLTSHIAWSWYWVLFPVTLPLTVIVALFVIALIGKIVLKVIE